jgi:hypothetical protein
MAAYRKHINMRSSYYFTFLTALEFELRSLHLLSRCPYCLSHSSSILLLLLDRRKRTQNGEWNLVLPLPTVLLSWGWGVQCRMDQFYSVSATPAFAYLAIC